MLSSIYLELLCTNYMYVDLSSAHRHVFIRTDKAEKSSVFTSAFYMSRSVFIDPKD